MTRLALPSTKPLRVSLGLGVCGTGLGARRRSEASCVEEGVERRDLYTRARSRRSYDVS
jgi:hypothetical protein